MSNKRKNKSILKKFIIPLLLLLLWIILTIFQIISNDGALTIVTEKYTKKDFKNDINYEPILAGESRAFEFKSRYDNLGSIAINFDTTGGGREDYMKIKVTELSTGKVIKEETTFAGAYQGLNFYPYGFELQPNSSGVKYNVEILSTSGSETKYNAIKKGGQIFAVSYQFNKQKILHDKIYLIEFIKTKSINSLQNNYLSFTTTIFALPLIFYLFWLFAEKHTKKKNLFNNPIIALLGISIVIDIFFVDVGFDLVFFIIPILWGGVLFYLKKESKESYKVALALLILCPILQLLGQDTMVEKAAAWAFLALTVGVIINLYELKKHPERFEDEN